jgi:hypothetical protein
MIFKINRFLILSFEEKRLVVETSILLSVVTAGLYLLPFKSFMKQIGRLEKKRKGVIKLRKFDSDKILWAVRRVSRYIPHARCLSQAITVKIMLINHIDPVQLRIGLKKSHDDGILAHAWLEQQGNIIIGNLADLHKYHILEPLEERKI